MSIKWENGLFEHKMGNAWTNQRGVNMRLFLSTLTEMDYIETLNKIESSYDDKGQVLVKSKENSFQDYAEH